MAGEIAKLIILSTAFTSGEAIPKKYTCEGEDVSPPLKISGIPRQASSLAIIVDDPDAPMGDFVHWVVWNLDPAPDLQENVKVAHEGRNDFGVEKYRGPCPPKGKPHRYFFKVYALNTKLRLPKGSGKRQLLEAMDGHIIGQGEITGTYQR